MNLKLLFFVTAQKLGLIEAPDQPLSEKEWHNVKTKSNERDDSKLPCVICKEDFGTQEQVCITSALTSKRKRYSPYFCSYLNFFEIVINHFLSDLGSALMLPCVS